MRRSLKPDDVGSTPTASTNPASHRPASAGRFHAGRGSAVAPHPGAGEAVVGQTAIGVSPEVDQGGEQRRRDLGVADDELGVIRAYLGEGSCFNAPVFELPSVRLGVLVGEDGGVREF